jgi:hypothetical protein
MIGIIEGPNPNEDQMRSCLSLAKERSSASWAKPAVHSIAAVRHTREVTRLPYDLERLGAKASANRPAACAQVLAIAAPAHPCSDRPFSALPTHRTAKAPTRHCHCALQSKSRRHTVTQIACSVAWSISAVPPNPWLHPTAYGGLRPPPSAGELKR